MGRDNHNAGIYLVPRGYRGGTDFVDTFDRYGAIIAENNLKKKANAIKVSGVGNSESLLADVELCNFIAFFQKMQCERPKKWRYFAKRKLPILG